MVALGERSKVLVRKKSSRAQLLAYMANLPASLISLEACSGAHFLGAALREQGHEVRLLPAQFVKPYRKSNKKDFLDAEVQFDSGLPFQFQCDPSLTLDQCIAGEKQTYGQQVVDRVNLAQGRIYPTVQMSASAGAEVYKSERLNIRFQIDGQDLTNVVNVIDFGGLFS